MQRQSAVAQQQQQMEEEAARERDDAEKLEALKNKDESAQSAVASSAVKQRLHVSFINKLGAPEGVHQAVSQRNTPIDYDCEDFRFLASTSCLTISNPCLFSCCETGVNPGNRS
jgi:hypothetical protein